MIAAGQRASARAQSAETLASALAAFSGALLLPLVGHCLTDSDKILVRILSEFCQFLAK